MLLCKGLNKKLSSGVDRVLNTYALQTRFMYQPFFTTSILWMALRQYYSPVPEQCFSVFENMIFPAKTLCACANFKNCCFRYFIIYWLLFCILSKILINYTCLWMFATCSYKNLVYAKNSRTQYKRPLYNYISCKWY